MSTRLTKKQKGFVKDYVKTGIASLAVKKNYNVANDNVARNIGSENLTKPNIVKTLQEMFPDDLLAEKHLELLNAGFIEKIGFEKDIEDEDILEVFKQAKGCKVLYIRHYIDLDKTAYVQVIDNNARKNALEMAYKLKGSYAPEKSVQVQVKINIEQQEKINKAIDEVI